MAFTIFAFQKKQHHASLAQDVAQALFALAGKGVFVVVVVVLLLFCCCFVVVLRVVMWSVKYFDVYSVKCRVGRGKIVRVTVSCAEHPWITLLRFNRCSSWF